MKILIVEDDHFFQEAVKRDLESAGYNVLICNNGRDAIKIIKDQEVRVAIIDWIMPGMDGITLCKEIRGLHLYRYVYIIMLTSKRRKQDTIIALEAGADDFLTKPADKEELISRIKVGMRILELENRLILSQRELLKLAKEDPLTNLLNRRSFLDEALKELDRAIREGREISTVMVDIDDFKRINDTYGHQIGDEIIIEFARRLQSSCRTYDILGRYGGEEFLILLPQTKSSSAVKIAKRIRSVIKNKPFKIMGEGITVTASFGVSVLKPDGRSKDDQIDDLVKRTDIALYEAKKGGKNRVAVNVK
ncbi:MAG: diguanylate cyclase [Spirochaetota bacterium]|nr:diguanylate cyclase [Spirochaetota bacterium]